jgi:hypothetical protein
VPVYPGPISPRCDPQLLGQVDHDPFGVMPVTFPRRPHVFVTPELLAITRDRLKTCAWAQACGVRLRGNCIDKDSVLDRPPDALKDVKVRGAVLSLALRNALAFLLTRERMHRDTALKAFRTLSAYGIQTPVSASGALVANGGLAESHAVLMAGHTFDLLAAEDLSAADDHLFRSFLKTTRAASHACGHYTCGNHNTWSQTGRLAVALALEDPQGIHEALYGCAGGARWRYGLIHQFRHDILADGMHWERTPGYHYYSLMGLTYAADAACNSGIDLWHKEFPMLQQDDLADAHRAYGPRAAKTLKAAYDAPFYLTFGNGDLSLLSDSSLANIRGAWVWGVVYNKAYEAYGDPKYAWLLNRMEKDYSTRTHPGVPMPLQPDRGDIDFVRVKHEVYPRSRWSLATDTTVGLVGRHEQGSTCLPVYGASVVRGGTDAAAPAAFVYYGPHIAGHQHPAALHADIHIGGLRLTDAPRLKGYNDPQYLTWGRTTVGNNTVVVDGASMFPYDFATDSIYECDRWRDQISDGELIAFQPGQRFSAVRVSNRNVYPGVILDRTLVASAEGVLDVYRVTAERPRQFDYVWHCAGGILFPKDGQPLDLGSARGYHHLHNGCQVSLRESRILEWQVNGRTCRCVLAGGAGKHLIFAEEPLPNEAKQLGELSSIQERKTVIQRIQAKESWFATFWSVNTGPDCLQVKKGPKAGDLIVEGTRGRRRIRWELPGQGAVSLR